MKYDNLWTSYPRVPLTDLLSFIVDNRGKTVPTSDSGIALIATNCVTNNTLYPVFEKIRYLSEDTYKNWFRAHPEPGDILFVNKGTPGRVCMVPSPVNFCIAQDMIALRADSKKLYNRFLFAVLRSKEIQTQIYNTNVGDTIPHFKKQFLNQIFVPLPDMRIQKFIGDMYFKFSEKIELNNKINANLQQQAQALFKSWFVDFEPWGGVMPEGWREGALSDICRITMGQSPDGASYNFSGNGAVFYQGRTDFNWRYPKRRQYTTQPTRWADSGDILLSVRAPVGDLNIAKEKCCIGRGLAAIHSKFSSFIFYTMKIIVSKKLDVHNAEGTVFGSVNKNDLSNVKILIPHMHILKQFEELVSPIDLKIKILSEQNDKLAELRDTLLPKLMSGELDVSDIELSEVSDA